jgi:hypothetical protein
MEEHFLDVRFDGICFLNRESNSDDTVNHFSENAVYKNLGQMSE